MEDQKLEVEQKVEQKVEEVKDAFEKKVETPPQELSANEQARRDAESQIASLDSLPPVPAEVQEEPKEPFKEEAKEETDPYSQIKEKVLRRLEEKTEKRIGKEVAKRKTAEEELQEAKAEIERLKSGKPEVKTQKEEKIEVTNDQIAAALTKAREEGDTKFELEILEFVAQRNAERVKDKTLKEMEERENTSRLQQAEQQRQWIDLVKDYTPTDETGQPITDHELSLSNPQSKLTRAAVALFNDPQLRKERYSSGSYMENIRRATSDAYLELTRSGINEKIETKPKTDAKERSKRALAEPGAGLVETESKPKSLTDTDKVLEEIKRRNEFRNKRQVAPV